MVDDEDITALEKIITLIQEFLNKNPIRKDKINYKRIQERVNESKQFDDKDNQLKFESFLKILKKLNKLIRKEIFPELFFLVGGHGGISINDIGFCEFDAPKFAMQRLLEKMKLAIETEMPYNIEVAMSCLAWINKIEPELIEKFIELFKRGRFEIINPTYSQPYSLLIGLESNIKQFEFGFKVLEQFGLSCQSYWASESSLHPQIPQLLKGFNLKYGSLRCRLLGTSPSTHSGHIMWRGLDDTEIETISDQSGIFNGEYWHGAFFKEFPTLLFQAVARPFLEHMIYSSIDDFINLYPYQEEIWRLARFSDVFGKFLLFSEYFNSTKCDGNYKFKRDDFYLGDYIFVPNDLFLNNRKSEICLISAEIVNYFLGIFNEKSNDRFLENAWRDLLQTQAHDNYAVPYIQPGDYSAMQLSNEVFNELEISPIKIPIADLSIELQKKLQVSCGEFITKGLIKIANGLGEVTEEESILQQFIVINYSNVQRHDIVSIPTNLGEVTDLSLIQNEKNCEFYYKDSNLKFIADVPPLGYAIYSLLKQKTRSSGNGEFYYEIEISKDGEAIQIMYKDYGIYRLEFGCGIEYQLFVEKEIENRIEKSTILRGKIKNQTFKLEIHQYHKVNRLEFVLNSNQLKEIILQPKIPMKKSIINYPFGVEETKRSKIQTLDFLLLLGDSNGIVFMVMNSQRFLIDRETFTIRNLINSKGQFEFAITLIDENRVRSALHCVNAYQFRLFGTEIDRSLKFDRKSDSFLSIQGANVQLINLWRRQNSSFLRILNPTYCNHELVIKGPKVENLTEISLAENEIKKIENNKLEVGPWKILNLKLN